jgi:hypothetical protein
MLIKIDPTAECILFTYRSLKKS